MAVMRVNKTADYTVISNSHFREKEMSLKAKGLLSLMLSLPDNWDYSIAGLVALSKDGKDSVMNTLTELETFGYLKRTKVKDDKGKFAGYDYDIYEQPQTEKPYAEKPNTDKPNTENPPQLNTNILNTKKLSTKEIINIDQLNAEFEKLWELYPRKIGKQKAFAAYQKARNTGTAYEAVEQGIKAYCEQIKKAKTKTEYIKHGATWFNGKCWLDEYEAETKTSTFDDSKYTI